MLVTIVLLPYRITLKKCHTGKQESQKLFYQKIQVTRT